MGRFSNLELHDAADAEPAGTAPRDYALRAEQAFRDGSYESALRYWSRALADDASREAAWVGQVMCLVNLGEFAEAVAWADRALGRFPRSAELTAAKAVAWSRSGDVDRAMAFSDSAMKMGGAPSAFVWWARGDILVALNPKTARFAFTKALELGKDDAQIHLAVGRTYLSCGDPREARRHLQRAEQFDRGNPVIWHHLGLACKALGLTDEARDAFRTVLQRHPGRTEAGAELAALERSGGSVGKAWQGLRRLFS